MSDRISELDGRTVERIAAGEVVERPASVVKELVENSLDAQATRIDVSVTGDGTAAVEVADDGVGMSEPDLRAAVRQHTTSKIGDIDDLESGVGTLGFRGEALHTIGAVSRTTITSRRENADVGTKLEVTGGTIESVSPAGRPPGTTVRVEDLFFNTPARRKYLKTESTEFGHVNRVVTRYALANPDVAISLVHDDTEVFSTSGRDDLLETTMSVYGRPVAESMIQVEHEEGDVAVHGYVSDPETTRSAREYVSTFVNGRYVRDGELRGAIVDAYGNQLAADRYPFAVVFLEVPPESVDVNVHPRKMEVRFDDTGTVRETIESAIEAALLEAGLIRTGAPRGRSAPEDTPVEPGAAGAPDGSSTPDDPESAVVSGDSLDGYRNDEDHAVDRKTWDPPQSDIGDGGPSTDDRSVPSAGDAFPDEDGTSRAAPNDEAPGDDASNTAPDLAADTPPASGGSQSSDSEVTERDSPASRISSDPHQTVSGPHEHAELTNVAVEDDFDTLPPLRVLGQVQETYVVAESPSGLVLVDQHAADERINYERLASELSARRDSQQLVSPVTVDLTAQERSVFEGAVPALREAGFEARIEGDEAVVEAVPTVFSDTLDPEVLQDVLASFLEDDGESVVDAAVDSFLSDLACYPSITGNTSLREGDVADLLGRLDECENPYACPHGRPVIVEISTEELAERFERDYPGHQTRSPE
ncbi:MAG: DNA mismatch repair endonuclease MutL [Halanaeroarchaeum sp.]